MKRFRFHKIRAVVVTLLVLLVLSGTVTHYAFGTFSAFGPEQLSAICPVGALEALVAGRSFVPGLLIGLGITVAAILILGRVFCAWACPVPYVQRWFRAPAKKAADGEGTAPRTTAALEAATPPPVPKKAWRDTRLYVLGGALASSAAFGFPVFCLVCPIGLFFGTIFAFVRLVRFNEPTWALLLFPAVLLLEVLLLRKWCHKICPIGALVSLLAGFNKTVRPVIDRKKCLTSSGRACLLCKQTCPEDIDLHKAPSMLANGLCTKCGDCVDACPAHAIGFKLKEKYDAEESHGNFEPVERA